jgi:hypothetical protein
MDAAPAAAAAVRVYRTTPIDAPLVDFADGATLVAADLDTNSRQSIYIQQELDDAQTDNLPNVIPNGNKGDITTTVGGTVWAINTGAVLEAKIATGAVVEAKVGTGAITETKLGTGAVTSAKILDGTIVDADVNASAGIVATKLAFTQAGTGATARTVDSRLKDVVSVKDFGAIGNGVADDTAAIQAAINTGKSVFFGPGGTYMVTGGISVSTNGQKIYGDGTIKKLGASIAHLFVLSDAATGIWFDGLTFDGTRASFSSGNPVSAIFGHINTNITVTNCTFQNIIDCGIKLRDSAGLTAIGNRFTNVNQNGIELRVYANDPRTGSPYPSRPTINGNHKIIGNHFSRIDDGNSGAGDGCGVTFDSIAANYPITNTVVSDNTFEDVLRSIWTENNVSGSEARNVVVKGNSIRGNLAGSGTVKTKDGIGLIGVQGAVVEGNTILNVGNFTPVGGECAGVQVSMASTRDVVIANNVIQDLTGAAIRTDYCINVAAGERIIIKNNITRGASDGQIRLVTASAAQVEISGNIGAEDEYSWGQPISLALIRQNIPANTGTIYFYPFGWTDDTDFIMPSVGKLVGISVKLSAAISAGTITITPYAGATALTSLSIVNADFGGGTVAYKKIESINGTLIGLGTRISVSATTDASFAPTTNDALAMLIFDASVKD